MSFSDLGFALYLAPAAAALLACDRMKERRRRHKIAAICPGIAVFVPPASVVLPDRIIGFCALVTLLAATSVCLVWPPFRPDLPGGLALRWLSIFACAVYLVLFFNTGGISM